MKIPYALPDIGPDEKSAVMHALDSGWVTTGPECAAFEDEFATYLGAGFTALAVNSATAGLHLAVEALGIGPGDEVIVPTMTFTATAEIVRYVGAEPVFADCDYETLNICPKAIEKLLNERTKAIIVVHYAGLACAMDEIIELAREHGVQIIEDAAHAFPATYKGAIVGTLETAVTVFSFYANKTMTTGEGGMVVSRDEALIARMRTMRLHGIDRDAFDRFRSEKPAWAYAVVAPGFKYNMTDVAAAMGRVQLQRIAEFQAKRNILAKRYDTGLADLPLMLPAKPSQGDQHAWHIYAVRLDAAVENENKRARFIERLSEEGIGTSVHYIPLHRQPYWQNRYRLQPQDFPNADRAYHRIVSLPLYTLMTEREQDYIIEKIRIIISDI